MNEWSASGCSHHYQKQDGIHWLVPEMHWTCMCQKMPNALSGIESWPFSTVILHAVMAYNNNNYSEYYLFIIKM